MALITPRTSGPSLDAATGMYAQQITGLYAAEALLACAPCYIKGSDGLVYQSNGTADNEASYVHGFTARAVAAGEPVTLYGPGARFGYADSGLTPGADYYVGTTAGRLDTAATTGGDEVVAFAINATDIMVCGRKLV